MELLLAEVWDKLGEQAPSLVVLVFLVIAFLKFLREERVAREEHEELRMKTLEALGDHCHAHQDRMMLRVESMQTKAQDVINNNTLSLDRNTAALTQFEKTVVRVVAKDG